jgi:hypothetical protein
MPHENAPADDNFPSEPRACVFVDSDAFSGRVTCNAAFDAWWCVLELVAPSCADGSGQAIAASPVEPLEAGAASDLTSVAMFVSCAISGAREGVSRGACGLESSPIAVEGIRFAPGAPKSLSRIEFMLMAVRKELMATLVLL